MFCYENYPIFNQESQNGYRPHEGNLLSMFARFKQREATRSRLKIAHCKLLPEYAHGLN